MEGKKPRLLMVVENSYPDDPRVRKEAESLVDTHQITVAAQKKKGERWIENVGGVQVIRVPQCPDIGLGKMTYMVQYLFFTFSTFMVFLVTYPLKRYKVIHVHNPPDTLFVFGLFGKLLGIKFVYDLHDLSPELYISRFGGKQDLIYRFLLILERWSCRLADVVITTNNSYRDLIVARHALDSSKVFIVRNDPRLEEWIDMPEEHNVREPTKTGIYVGSINPQDGLDILLEVVHKLVHERGRRDFVFQILGGGDSLKAMKKMSRKLDIEGQVRFEGFISDRETIVKLMFRAQVGVESAPESPLNKHSTFIKVMEYMASCTPVVAFDLTETRYSANGAALLVTPGDIEGFADAVEKLFDNEDLCRELGKRGRDLVEEKFNWDRAAESLHGAYRAVFSKSGITA